MPVCVLCEGGYTSYASGPSAVCPACWLQADPCSARAKQAASLQQDFDELKALLRTVDRLVITGRAKFRQRERGWACSIHLSNGAHHRCFLEAAGDLSAAGRANVLSKFQAHSWTLNSGQGMAQAVGELMTVPVYCEEQGHR